MVDEVRRSSFYGHTLKKRDDVVTLTCDDDSHNAKKLWCNRYGASAYDTGTVCIEVHILPLDARPFKVAIPPINRKN